MLPTCQTYGMLQSQRLDWDALSRAPCMHHIWQGCWVQCLAASAANRPVGWVANRDRACSQLRLGDIDAREVIDAKDRVPAGSPAAWP